MIVEVKDIEGNTQLGIAVVSNSALLEAFEDAVCDRNYNPTNDNYNKSGYTYAELKAEIVDRLQGGEQLRIE